MENKRSTFGSRFGAIAVVGGAAIGLGNIWKFPYVAGENGGAAFILIYIAISILISIPVMLSEFAIGRRSQKNTLGAFKVVSQQKGWRSIGYLGILAAFVILSFYSVIAGWSLEFIKESVAGEFMHSSVAEVTDHFTAFVASGWRPSLWTLGFLALNCVVVALGINKGIERYSKILMPLLAILLLAMAVGSVFLSGWRESAEFLFKPDWSKITPSAIISAMGQSFFSMSLGMGAMITYGSYIDRRENLYKVAGTVAVADVTVAILAGLAIFPAVFTYGINPTSGPELVFITLPALFAQIPGGYVISIAFFFLLFFAAVTSSFSLLEVIVAYLSEEFKIARTAANVISFFAVGVLGVLCALSQMPDSSLYIGKLNLFDFFDTFSSNYLLPIGGLAIVIFTGWFFNRNDLKNELTSNGLYGRKLYSPLLGLIRYIVPVAIVLMFLNLTGVAF